MVLNEIKQKKKKEKNKGSIESKSNSPRKPTSKFSSTININKSFQ